MIYMSNWGLNNANFSVLRMPYLPEDTMDPLESNLIGTSNEKSIKKSLRELIKISNRQDIVQAIEFASSSLSEKINHLTEDLTVENLKLASSIYKYMTRMSTRSTPFGAFSSVMTLSNEEETKVNIDKNLRLYLRVDNGCVLEIANVFEKQAIVEKNQDLYVRQNTSLYMLGDEIRFVSKVQKEKYVDFKLDEVKQSVAINTAIKLSKNWMKVSELVSELTKQYEQVDPQQLTEFVYNLLENQLLESNLGIVLTSTNSFKQLISRIKQSNIKDLRIEKLQQINDILDSTTLLNDENIKSKLERAKALLVEIIPDFEMIHWLHVDSFRSGQDLSIGNNIIKPLVNKVRDLADFFWRPNQELDDFTAKFIEIYGESEVSLLEALDIDNGISFGQKRLGRSPLLHGVMPSQVQNTINIDWGNIDGFFMQKILEAVKNNKNVIKVTTKEIEKFRKYLPKSKNYNDSVSINGVVYEDENNKTLYKINSVIGPSGIALLGRFCCGDKELENSCREFAKQEQGRDENAIYAEIVHIPQPRAANISCRPVLRDKEIVYGPGDSNITTKDQISCDDLYLIVVSGKLVLFSKKLNKEVKPRMASAHNTSGLNLPIYQLLNALQGGNGRFVGMMLNQAIESLPYIPEIRIDNLVLFDRRWLLVREDVEKIHKGKTDDEKLILLKEMVENKEIARYVALSEGDNLLDFDLHSPLSALFFINEIKNKYNIKIIASVKGRTHSVFSGENGKYRHEFVVPCFMKQDNIQQKEVIDFNKSFTNIKQTKEMSSLPSENWKYLKIYTGEASADKLIANYIEPMASKLKLAGHIESWFFIRYQDPEFHLRVRFKLPGEYQTDTLNQVLYQPLKELYKQGIIQNIAEDSYIPEMQRYGGMLILSSCEDLFYLNSKLVSDIIGSTFSNPEKDQIRWKMCLRIAWQLTMEVCESLEQAEQFFKAVAASYDNEFNSSADTKKKLNLNYREAMKEVADALSMDFEISDNEIIKKVILPEYSNKITHIKQLCTAHHVDVMALIQSIIHMDCNRIFVISPRINEWVIYHYLAKYTRTVIARKFQLGVEVTSGFNQLLKEVAV